MDLITQVKKELEERKKKETKIKIEGMLNLISSKKEQVEKLNKEVKKLEADLLAGDFSKLDATTYPLENYPNYNIDYSTWCGGTIYPLEGGGYSYCI